MKTCALFIAVVVIALSIPAQTAKAQYFGPSSANELARDKWGNHLEDKFGDPVFIDSVSRKPVDESGFKIKGQDVYNENGIGRYDLDEPIYDGNGFKAKRWEDN